MKNINQDHKKRWGLITRFIRENNFKNIAEIGVKNGENAGHILRLNPNLKIFILVDSFIDLEFYNEVPKNKCIYFNKTSKEAVKFIADSSLDLVFIDGDHSYEVVKQDIIDWYPKVKLHGIVCGHDYHPNKDGVVKAVDELLPDFTKEVDNCWWVRKIFSRLKAKNINIDWGSGKITRGKWLGVKKVMNHFKIKSVLEFGSGLSTELFSLENIEFESYDVLDFHVDRLQKALPDTKTQLYTDDEMCVIDQREKTFLNKKPDMVFIDGPVGGRRYELEVANLIAQKVIYCDDWGRQQDEVSLDSKWKSLEDFDPHIVKGEKDKHIYINEENIH